jgi:hypothetical protein
MSDLLAERLRIRSGSVGNPYYAWTLSAFNGTDPNGLRVEPSGSLLRDVRGRVWINVNNASQWSLWGGNAQVWTQTATGLEGSTLSAVLPVPMTGTDYQAFVTNYSGTYSPAFKIINKTTTAFDVVSTAPFIIGDRVDLLAVSGGLGATIDGQAFTNFSGTFNSAIVALSGTTNSAIVNLSGTINARISTLSAANIWDKPVTPHAYDEEFESTSLPAAWSWSAAATQGTIDPYLALAAGDVRYELHTDRRRSWMIVQAPGDGTQRILQRAITVPTDCFMWFRGNFCSRLAGSPANNDFTIGLTLGDVGFANVISIVLNESDAGAIQAEFSKTGATIITTTDKFTAQAEPQEFEAMGIQKIGTTWHAWAFSSNGCGVYLGNTTFTSTVVSASFRFTNSTTTTPGAMLMGVDFFRFVESATWLP